jgi:hypothetical protein
LVLRVKQIRGELLFISSDESLEEFEQFGQDIQFEPYTAEESMNLLRAIKNFLTKERTSPFSLDVPEDFAIAQWGI